MKRSDGLARVRVTADGAVVVSHAGAERSREMAGLSGLIDTSDAALMPRTRRCRSTSRMRFADLAGHSGWGGLDQRPEGRCGISPACSARSRRRPPRGGSSDRVSEAHLPPIAGRAGQGARGRA